MAEQTAVADVKDTADKLEAAAEASPANKAHRRAGKERALHAQRDTRNAYTTAEAREQVWPRRSFIPSAEFRLLEIEKIKSC